MPNTSIEIKAETPVLLAMRKKSLESINKLDDEALSRLGKMAESPTAINYIKNSWEMLKGLVGIE